MKIVKEFILRKIAGECVLVPTGTTSQEFNGMVTLSETAGFIWEHLEEAECLEDLVRQMREVYEVDEETATQDAVGFISALMERGIVACTKEDETW